MKRIYLCPKVRTINLTTENLLAMSNMGMHEDAGDKPGGNKEGVDLDPIWDVQW